MRFLTGTDEHGLKMAQTAAAEGIPTAELARRNSDVFQQLQEKLDISFDRFIRTTDADHYEASKEIWQRMNERGDIYLDTYSGWYSVRDERFFTEAETASSADGIRVATETGTPVTWTEEQTYFFRLSAYADRLLAHYEAHPEFIAPRRAPQRGGQLRLRRAARPVDLADLVRLGRAGARPSRPRHVRLGRRADQLPDRRRLPDTDSELFRRYWPADLHMIGKDIIRFHTVYWPAFLMSAGIELPRRVFAHGFLYNRGEKMSKSVGNVVDPVALVDDLRRRSGALLPAARGAVRPGRQLQRGRASSPGSTPTWPTSWATWRSGRCRWSTRTSTAWCPSPASSPPTTASCWRSPTACWTRCGRQFDEQAMHQALEAIWLMLGAANRYFSAQEPWVLRKSEAAADQDRFRTVLYMTLEVVRIAALLVQPVMPSSAAKLLDLLGQPETQRDFTAVAARLAPGTALPAPVGVFPRYQVD